MMVNTDASDFRALVQELTGQDADLGNPTKFSETYTGVEKIKDYGSRNDKMERIYNTPDLPFEPFDEVFKPQIIESFTGLSPSSLVL